MDLMLMSTRDSLLRAAFDPAQPPSRRASALIVDLERTGKAERQRNALDCIGVGTTISTDTLDDLVRARRMLPADIPLICRTNSAAVALEHDIEAALAGGADELLIPMVRTPAEVERVIAAVRGRARLGIMVETAAAVACIDELAALPLSRVYVGLMDLAIERRSPSPFTAMIDGTVERIRAAISMPVGVAGLTVPGMGAPVPSVLLMAEMARLGCGFAVLRRSFIADTADRCGPGVAGALAAINTAVTDMAARDDLAVDADRRAFVHAVHHASQRQGIVHA
jgi:hypothetical protein